MTDTLTCPFCEELAKFNRIINPTTQVFQCIVCHKSFAVATVDVLEKPRTQMYDTPPYSRPYEEAKRIFKIGKKR